MWKRLEKAGERKVKMHPVALRENAACELFCIPAIKEIYVFACVSNKIYVRYKYGFKILHAELCLIERSITSLNFYDWAATPN